MERIHKDASICPYCQTETYSHYDFTPAGYGEVRTGSSTAMKISIALVIVIVVGAGLAILMSLDPYGVNATSTSTSVTAPNLQAKQWVTRRQFDQLQKDMPYKLVVMKLGFEGDRVSEIRLDSYRTIVTYRWVNPDGSMIAIDFLRLGSIDDAYADSISSVGLIK
jgi:hypothetical protein